MSTYQFNPLAYGTVAVPPNPPQSGLTLTLNPNQGIVFELTSPNVAAVCIAPPNADPATVAAQAEIATLESVSGDVLTLSGRATEGPNQARNVQVGDVVTIIITPLGLASLG